MKRLLFIAILLFAFVFFANNTSASVIARPVINSGLVGHWNFDVGKNGSTAYDMSGQRNNGMLTNMNKATAWVDSKTGQGQALSFDGVNDYVNLGGASLSTKTVSFWMKANSTTQSILDLNGTATITETSGTLSANNFTSPTIYVDGAVSSTANDTNWHHIVVTTNTAITANAIKFGVIGSTYFNGLIDDVRIYNRALSASEVTRLYNLTKTKIGMARTFPVSDNFPAHATTTEFISTIKQSGGDYSTLSAWEAAVQVDLTASTTAVYSGTGTGSLSNGNVLELFRGGTYQNATSTLVATTSSQILVQKYYNSGAPITLQSGDQWRKASSTANMFTVSGSGAQLGDTAIATAKIDGAWTAPDTTAVTIDGWTTDATHYIKIYTTQAARHTGKWDNNKYRILYTTSGGLFKIMENYTRIDGLQLESNRGQGLVVVSVTGPTADNVKIMNSIIKSSVDISGSSGYGIQVGGSVKNISIYNNIVYGFKKTTGGLNSVAIDSSYDNTGWIYNNTVYDSDYGFTGYYSQPVLKNNIAQQIVVKGFYPTGGGSPGFGAGSDYNISNLASDAPSPSYRSGLATTVSFVDAANKDFHLSSADTSAKDAGTNLSADANLAFSDDIDRQPRPFPVGGSWDIGADEVFGIAKINSSTVGKVTNGLVGHWTFDGPDMAGVTAYDRSGQGNNGTLTNGPVRAIGKIGQALSFVAANGPDVNAGSATSLDDLDTKGGLSYSAWIYPKSLGNSSGPAIVMKDDGNSSGHVWFYVSRGNPYRLIFQKDYATTDLNRGSLDNTIKLNTWQHVVVTWDGSGTATNVHLFRNGLEVSYSGAGTDGVGAKVSDAARTLRIGNWGGSSPMDGLIDDVRVYGRVLSAGEITRLYNLGR